MSFFVANGISAGYGKEPVIKNLSFQLEDGVLMGVIGANGSGKTTLLKALCGILPHQESVTSINAGDEAVFAENFVVEIDDVQNIAGAAVERIIHAYFREN